MVNIAKVNRRRFHFSPP